MSEKKKKGEFREQRERGKRCQKQESWKDRVKSESKMFVINLDHVRTCSLSMEPPEPLKFHNY